MSPLDNVAIIRHAHAMLPVVCISICQLVEFPIWLVRDIKHALVMCKHLILLKPNCSELRIAGLKLHLHFEGLVADYARSLVGVDDEVAVGHACYTEYAVLAYFLFENIFDKPRVKFSFLINLQLKQHPLEYRMIRPLEHFPLHFCYTRL